jgi:hypothetical protein
MDASIVNLPRKLDVLLDVTAKLERDGADRIRRFLTVQDPPKVNPHILYQIGCGGVQDWLRWKKELGPFRSGVEPVRAAAQRLFASPLMPGCRGNRNNDHVHAGL